MALLISVRGAPRRAAGAALILSLAAAAPWGWETHSAQAAGQRLQAPERDLKAVFLLRLAEFVDWPANAFQNEDAPFVLTILGPDPFGSALDALAGERVHGRRLEIRRVSAFEEASDCHALFTAESDGDRLRDIMARIGKRSVLTIGESPAFNARGGIVRFFTAGGRVRLAVNERAARKGGLTISSRLLRLADVVSEGD